MNRRTFISGAAAAAAAAPGRATRRARLAADPSQA